MIRGKGVISVLLVALFISGCAATSNFMYKVPRQKNIQAVNAQVFVEEIKDARTLFDDGIIGYATNVFGHKLQTFRNPEDFLGSLRTAFAETFRSHGYSVGFDRNDLVLKLVLNETTCSSTWNTAAYNNIVESKISFNAILLDKNEVVFEETYEATQTSASGFLGGTCLSHFQKILNEITKDLMADSNAYVAT